MTAPMRTWLATAAMAAVGVLLWSRGVSAGPAPAPPSAASALVDTAAPPTAPLRRAIDALQLEEAEGLCAALEAKLGRDPAVTYYRGVLKFYRGDYAGALAAIDDALAAGGSPPPWEQMRALVLDTLEVTRGFARTASPDGRYVVTYSAADALLAPYALDVLAKTDRAVEAALGLRLPGPVRLEIFPSASALAQVSALTVEQIETTGTIALSKWDRLMVTSPRALVRGYAWADTINHEFVHMVVSRMTGERAPVWLQEGLAKLMERQWRGGELRLRLDPSARGLIETAVRESGLISFDEMHPSIAMLPSQDAAALAFAEVATFMDRYATGQGLAVLRTALGHIRSGVDARDALGKAAGQPFAQLERRWRAGLPRGKAGAGPGGAAPRRLKLRLAGGEGKQDESLDVVQEEARRFLRLGDLLWDRGRTRAAAAEYEKAHAADADDPIVASRFARAALDAGQHARARDAIAPVAERYPDHGPAHAVLGAAELALGRPERAAPALRDAVMINPFDPQPQCDLARSTTFDAERLWAQNACDLLRRR